MENKSVLIHNTYQNKSPDVGFIPGSVYQQGKNVDVKKIAYNKHE